MLIGYAQAHLQTNTQTKKQFINYLQIRIDCIGMGMAGDAGCYSDMSAL